MTAPARGLNDEPFRLVVESAPIAIVVVDREGRITLANTQTERWSGYTREELRGKLVELLIPERFRSAHLAEHQSFLAAPEPRLMDVGRELFLRRKDGSEFPAEIRMALAETNQGSMILTFIADIAERNQAESSLRDHARLATLRADLGAILGRLAPLDVVLQDAAAALVAHLQVAFFRIWTLNDAEGVLDLQASAGLYSHRDGRHARIPLGEFKIGRIALRRTPHLTNDVRLDPEISDPEWAAREGMVAFAGYPLLVEERVVGVMATFARRPLDSIVLRDLGAVAHSIAQCIERKRAEAALRDSEQRLRLIVENAQLGLWDWEIAKNHQYLDARCRAILGLEPDEPATYERWLQGIHPEDKPRVLAALQQNLNGETALLDVDYRFGRKNGEWVWISARGRVHQRSADGRPLRMMGTINDISARKQAEIERDRFETQIQHAQKLESLGVLAGGIAHDFNNLLTGVLGNATLAQEELAPESPVIPMLHSIELAATRAADLAQQMLAYSGKGQFTVQVFQLDRVVREMSSLLKTVVSKKAVIQQRLESAVIDGDPRQIRQVVMNLITNASEALGEQVGTIRLSTGVREMDEAGLRSPFLPDPLPAGTYAFVEVEDSGCGMNDETLERIFDPFFTTKFTGRGLGLAAVLGIVRGHRGTIKVTSKVGDGAGSVFTVLLPVARETPPLKVEPAPRSLSLGQGTILVVEDEDVVRDYAKAALERAGYRVLTASDGGEGLAIFAEHRPEIDAVLLDLTMPRLDGPEVLRELRNQAPDVPVLIMSGFTDEEVAIRFEGIGASGFIRKPFAAHDLAAHLRRLLVAKD
jgi:PAS domain S-box-containing protein